MKKLLSTALLLLMSIIVNAQRFTDNLDRGLVAVNMGGSTFLSWRILADEYHGVTYNVYRDGTKIAEGLTVSNYTDSGTGTSYTVSAVADGVEKAQSMVTSPWTNMDTGGIKNVSSATYPGYIDIALATVSDRNGADVTSQYVANDAIFADLNGDGDLEFIIKRMNMTDANNFYPETNTTAYDVIEAYDLDYSTGVATRMWWIDCGPNMVSLNSTEINFLAYDWDEDGIAEVVLRGADNMIVHTSTGASYVIGTSGVNTRSTITHAANATFTNTGKEYLIYLNGQTGDKYQVMEYPLKRIEDSEYSAWSGTYTEAQMEQMAWGNGILGHRSSKYFMGAPFLDGRSASLFLARGIYTRHKMMALTLSGNHQWSTRWTWTCNDSSSPWYGQGFHNFVIADVDNDGRDEIMYGSMVIDDNGKGLHTTGYGHGDAMHVGDFDPYRQGPELFVCLEENPHWGSAYRSGTTGEVYYKYTSTPTAEQLAADPKAGDDGRCMAGNFLSDIPGGQARSVGSGLISCVTDQELFSNASAPFAWEACNFRIYWDGDLLDELLYNSSTEGEVKLDKPNVGRLFTSDGCHLNNGTKCNPCFSGDVLGDWREEILVRTNAGVRLYTTTIPTEHAMPSLWFDHQYRQAMGTQMQVYNQPPHVSYFMGELEDITMAPPPLTTCGRTLISDGGTFSTNMDGKDLLMCGYANQTYTFSGKISPHSIVINVPAWIQGNDDNNNITTTTTYTHTLTYSGSDAGIQGNTYFVKQGLGTLNMPKKTLSYTGPTEIWGGTVNFDGTLGNSKVWMNRHTTLNSSGTFNGGLEMNYGATLNVGGATAQNIKTVTISDLTLNYGARVVMDVNSTTATDNDQLVITNLTIGTKDWQNGPTYSTPVMKVNSTSTLADGRYPIGTVSGTVTGSLQDVVLEDAPSGAFLKVSDGVLYLMVGENRELDAPTVTLNGMVPYTGDYYLPTVAVDANNAGVSTTLGGQFTDTEGTTSVVAGTLYSEDYESATDASSWTNGAGTLELVTGDGTYGNYIHHSMISTNIAANRSAYTLFGNLDFSTVSKYNLEFDTRIAAGNVADRSATDLVVMTNDATIPTTKNVGYAFDSEDHNSPINPTGSNYLFRMNAANSQVFTINDGTETITLDASLWYHIKLSIDVESKTVAYTVSQAGTTKAAGTYTVPTTSCLPKGLFILDGRGSGDSKFDNLKIYTTFDDGYRFTKLGTLTVTASATGYNDHSVTYTVDRPYAIYYESPAYNEIQAGDVQATLGTKWNNTSFNSRWAFWNSANSTYGESYVFVARANTADQYVDNDSILKVATTSGLHLVEGFGLGRNKTNDNLTFSAQNLGNEETVVYYKADLSRGNAAAYDEAYVNASADGSWSYDLYQNMTFCKFIAYVPIDEEYDENGVSAPTGAGNGNVMLMRSGMSTSGWNTLVLPCAMSTEQVLAAFGPGTVVARLNTAKGDATNVYFSTNQRVIGANEPFLLKPGRVKDNGHYVIAGIDREPTSTAMVSTANFDFIGFYSNQGKKAFNTNDYFFSAASGKLATVKTNGTQITMLGYRAYFHATSATGAKTIGVSFVDDVPTGISDVDGECGMRQDIFDLQGRKVASGMTWTEARRLLRRGVYMVNGKRMIVK